MTAHSNPAIRVHYGTDAERLAYAGPLGSGDLWVSKAGVSGWDGTGWYGGGGSIQGDIKVFDSNGILLFWVDSRAAQRKIWAFDENGVAVTFTSGLAANRLVDVFDTTGAVVTEVDTIHKIVTRNAGVVISGVNKGVNFSSDPAVSEYFLTADGLTITLDDALLGAGWSCSYVSTTGTLAPANIFSPTAGTIVSSGIPAAATSTWAPGATVVTVTKKAAGVYVRS